MRELEFLPAWYHQTRRRKRVVAFQGWLLLIVIVGLGSWIGLADRNLQAREVIHTTLERQVDQTHTEQKLLTEQLALRKELQAREKLIASLGVPVEMTRLLQTLDTLMPKEMSIVEFDCDTELVPRPVTSVAAVRGAIARQRLVDRKMNVLIIGVAPNDIDLASFIAGLTRVPFFEQVTVVRSKDKLGDGHIFREFEITFAINLSEPTGN